MVGQQQTLFDTEPKIRRDDGINRAVKHADEEVSRWSNMFYAYCLIWLKNKPAGYEFLMEEIRMDAEKNGFPIPPSKRASGGAPLKLAKNNKIIKVGYGQTTNPKAHCANATRWAKV